MEKFIPYEKLSKKERETMNKKPYYRQTAVIFFMMGIVFLVLGLAIFPDAFWFTYIAEAVILIILIYAVASSIVIFVLFLVFDPPGEDTKTHQRR